MELDEKDLKIIKLLSENARITYTELSKALGISDVAVIKRVKKLETHSIIRRYTIDLNLQSLGYRILSFTGIDVDPSNLLSVAEELKKREQVIGLMLTTGDHQLMAVVIARDHDDLKKVHDEIMAIPGIKRVCPAIVLDTLKELPYIPSIRS